MRRRPEGANRLVVFTPLPPLANGIADYAVELLPWLARSRPTTVVIDDHAPEPAEDDRWQVLRVSEYAAREAEFANSAHLYQVGNNPDHVFLLPWLIQRPGVVVLHDVSLHHLVDQETVRWGDTVSYAQRMGLEYGQPGRVLARQFTERRWRTRPQFHELTMTRELLGRARAVIVHSLYAQHKVEGQQPGLAVTLVRHHVAEEAKQAATTLTRAAARSLLGVHDDALLLVSLGFVTRAKQIETVLRFLHRHRPRLGSLRYVIVGEDNPADYDVRSLIGSLGLQDIVKITGFADEATFYRYIRASDLVVNLRYPSGGETSGTLIRALGMGACVVVNDVGAFAEYPDTVCAKVPIIDGRCDDALEQTLLDLLASPATRARMGIAARSYMQATHSIEESARRYLTVLKAAADRPVLSLPVTVSEKTLPPHRREALLASLKGATRSTLPLWAAEGVVPVADPAQPSSVAIWGCAPADTLDLLRCLFGYGPSATRRYGSLPTFPQRHRIPSREHGLALLHVQPRRAVLGLAQTIAGINYALRHGALLLLTLEDDAPGSDLHGRTLHAACVACEAAGFEVERIVHDRESPSPTLDAPEPDPPPETRVAQVLVCARKAAEFFTREAQA
jgi:glycosyltransferase involved in cell wall biosynthesis